MPTRPANQHDSDVLACGVVARRALGDRHYLVRLPKHAACTAGHAMPLAVLIHCYGCQAGGELAKFTSAADSLGFGLAAPEGIGRSFHAPHCCGEALAERVDDVGLIDSIVDELLAAAGRAGRPTFLASALFASGFSNGGFLTTHLADRSRHAWAGLAPTAGHEYYLRRNVPLPISIHHCSADEKVNTSGCCMAPAADGQLGPTCCCGIVAKTCVSTRSIFERWLVVNRCSGERELPAAHSPAGAACAVGVGCTAETSLCLYKRCRHIDWSGHFPAAEAVFAFFARQAPTQPALSSHHHDSHGRVLRTGWQRHQRWMRAGQQWQQ